MYGLLLKGGKWKVGGGGLSSTVHTYKRQCPGGDFFFCELENAFRVYKLDHLSCGFSS